MSPTERRRETLLPLRNARKQRRGFGGPALWPLFRKGDHRAIDGDASSSERLAVRRRDESRAGEFLDVSARGHQRLLTGRRRGFRPDRGMDAPHRAVTARAVVGSRERCHGCGMWVLGVDGDDAVEHVAVTGDVVRRIAGRDDRRVVDRTVCSDPYQRRVVVVTDAAGLRFRRVSVLPTRSRS
jgi:hypothetical protein